MSGIKRKSPEWKTYYQPNKHIKNHQSIPMVNNIIQTPNNMNLLHNQEELNNKLEHLTNNVKKMMGVIKNLDTQVKYQDKIIQNLQHQILQKDTDLEKITRSIKTIKIKNDHLKQESSLPSLIENYSYIS